MNKRNKNHENTKRPDSMESAIYSINLVVVSYACIAFMVSWLDFNSLYEVIAQSGIIVTLLLMTTATLLALRGQASKLLLNTLRVLAVVSAISLLAITYGATQDMSGAKCMGLFGTTQSCVDSAIFAIQIMLFSQPILLLIAFAFSTALAIGLLRSLRKLKNF